MKYETPHGPGVMPGFFLFASLTDSVFGAHVKTRLVVGQPGRW